MKRFDYSSTLSSKKRQPHSHLQVMWVFYVALQRWLNDFPSASYRLPTILWNLKENKLLYTYYFLNLKKLHWIPQLLTWSSTGYTLFFEQGIFTCMLSHVSTKEDGWGIGTTLSCNLSTWKIKNQEFFLGKKKNGQNKKMLALADKGVECQELSHCWSRLTQSIALYLYQIPQFTILNGTTNKRCRLLSIAKVIS